MEYKISGTVIKGHAYGRRIGFPTVNLRTELKELPPYGIYAGVGVLEDVEYRAGIIVDPSGGVEAHLIGYNGDAYGKEVELVLNKFLREFKKFDTEEELIIQIKKDIEQCKI